MVPQILKFLQHLLCQSRSFWVFILLVRVPVKSGHLGIVNVLCSGCNGMRTLA